MIIVSVEFANEINNIVEIYTKILSLNDNEENIYTIEHNKHTTKLISLTDDDIERYKSFIHSVIINEYIRIEFFI